MRNANHHEEAVVSVVVVDERDVEVVLAFVVVDAVLIVGDVDADLPSLVQRIASSWPAEVLGDAVAGVLRVRCRC